MLMAFSLFYSELVQISIMCYVVESYSYALAQQSHQMWY